MGCTLINQKYKSFNHHQILQQLFTTFKATQFVSLQTFETYFNCAQSSLQQYTLSSYSRHNNSNQLLARFRLFLLCNRYTVYQPGFYRSNQTIKHHTFKSISKDVHRTYPNQLFFNIQENIIKFERVLQHIALYFPQHGYTQGINFIVGFLLLQGANQQQAFWMFVNLALNHNFVILGLYQQGFPLAELYYYIFQQLLKKYFPRLHAKLSQNNIAKESWIFQWFLTFFSYSFPLQLAMIFWEYIMINGSYSMIYLSLGFINQIESKLIELEDDVKFCQFFQNLRDKQVLLKTLKDINFKNIFNFAQKLKFCQNNVTLIVQNCPFQSKYKSFFSKSEEQKIEQIQIFKAQIDFKRNLYFNNPANQIEHSKSIIETQLIQVFSYDIMKKNKQDSSSILETKNVFSDQFQKQNSTNF